MRIAPFCGLGGEGVYFYLPRNPTRQIPYLRYPTPWIPTPQKGYRTRDTLPPEGTWDQKYPTPCEQIDRRLWKHYQNFLY